MNKPIFPIFQIKVTLKYIKPPIWRRLLVRSETTLADLHPILQAAMGWWNSHLHMFRIGDVRFSYPYNLDHLVELTAVDSSTVHLYNIVPVVRLFGDRPNPVICYEYDYCPGARFQPAAVLATPHRLEYRVNCVTYIRRHRGQLHRPCNGWRLKQPLRLCESPAKRSARGSTYAARA